MNRKQKAHRYGIAAEKIAGIYLRCKGYRIIAERYRNTQGEIDLLAYKRNTLVAIEVKARQSFAACYDSIPEWKRHKIARAMQGAVAGHGGMGNKIARLGAGRDHNIRFDVVWIVPFHWPRHIKDAWRIG